jgi:hypothetical protein
LRGIDFQSFKLSYTNQKYKSPGLKATPFEKGNKAAQVTIHFNAKNAKASQSSLSKIFAPFAISLRPLRLKKSSIKYQASSINLYKSQPISILFYPVSSIFFINLHSSLSSIEYRESRIQHLLPQPATRNLQQIFPYL